MKKPTINVKQLRADSFEWFVAGDGYDASGTAPTEDAADEAARAWLDRWLAAHPVN